MKLAACSVRGFLVFVRHAFLLFPACLLAFGLTAAEGPSESNAAGQELAARLRSLRPAENTEVRGAFNIQRQDHDTQRIPLVMKVVMGNSSWETIYETAPIPSRPAERLIIRRFADKPNEYLFGQGVAITNPAPVPRQMLDTRLGGSDFTFMDLGLEFLHWPMQRVIKTEKPAMKMGQPCEILESRTPRPIGPYSKVRCYVTRQSGGIISAEAFDQNNTVAKEFAVRKMQKGDEGHYELKEMRMIDNKANSRTRIDFEVGNGK